MPHLVLREKLIDDAAGKYLMGQRLRSQTQDLAMIWFQK